jgi:predicted DNA-binding transcriptional regulator AlpA
LPRRQHTRFGGFCFKQQGDRQLRFLLYDDLRIQKGIPYSDRQLKRLEAKGTFPKRVPLAGGSIKGWAESVIDEHLEALAEVSRAAQKQH